MEIVQKLCLCIQIVKSPLGIHTEALWRDLGFVVEMISKQNCVGEQRGWGGGGGIGGFQVKKLRWF